MFILSTKETGRLAKEAEKQNFERTIVFLREDFFEIEVAECQNL